MLLRGSFPEERAVYTQALEELLPEGEEVSEQVDRSAKMREVRHEKNIAIIIT